MGKIIQFAQINDQDKEQDNKTGQCLLIPLRNGRCLQYRNIYFIENEIDDWPARNARKKEIFNDPQLTALEKVLYMWFLEKSQEFWFVRKTCKHNGTSLFNICQEGRRPIEHALHRLEKRNFLYQIPVNYINGNNGLTIYILLVDPKKWPAKEFLITLFNGWITQWEQSDDQSKNGLRIALEENFYKYFHANQSHEY